MTYTLKNGKAIIDEEIEELAQACEMGKYPGKPGKWIIRPVGRPKQTTEELVNIGARIPVSMRKEILARAKNNNESVSSFVRNALAKALL